jgi:hypothetical protein
MKSNRIRRSVFAFAAALVSVVACNATSGTDSLNQIAGAFCAKAVSCNCTTVQPCTSTLANAIQADGFNTNNAYTTSSVNQCTSAINALPCTTSCVVTVPDACPLTGSLPLGTPASSSDAGAPADDAGTAPSSDAEASG